MQVTDKRLRPLTEAKYLNADNVDRYRSIMRIFYENYEKLRYWLYQEEVYAQMTADPYFADYRMEQCQQDLNMLTEWKNLNTVQDTRRVSSIEEFKNKKFRYQMSEYSVEIERLVLRLENLFIEGASLEPTLLERIRLNVERFARMDGEDAGTVYTWWNDLNNDFIRLNQNYQDYIRDLNSVKAEEMMRTAQFLVFKDKLVEYLRNFVKGLQKNVGVIEENLRLLDPGLLERVLAKVNDYEMSIPRMDVEVSRELIEENTRGRFDSIRRWFVAEGGQENEAGRLFDATNEIIRRITRYAAQLSEKNALEANRREEYRKAAEIFLRCQDTGEARRMSAMVFGLEKPCHLRLSAVRETDSMNGGVYEEKAAELILKPRVRTYREKAGRTAIRDTSWEKAQARSEAVEQMKKDWKKIGELEKNGRIDFGSLPVIEARVREILLKWLSDALEDADHLSRTEDGREFVLDLSRAGERCVVRCEDGNFTMPRLSIVFRDGTGEGRDFLGEGGEAGRGAALPAGKKRGGA